MKALSASLSRRAVVNNDMFPLGAVDGGFGNLTDRRSLEGRANRFPNLERLSNENSVGFETVELFELCYGRPELFRNSRQGIPFDDTIVLRSLQYIQRNPPSQKACRES